MRKSIAETNSAEWHSGRRCYNRGTLCAAKLRVFISSTMEDLANERDTVVRKNTEFNFEPVNAVAILPNGATSWDRIFEEYYLIPAPDPLAEKRFAAMGLRTIAVIPGIFLGALDKTAS